MLSRGRTRLNTIFSKTLERLKDTNDDGFLISFDQALYLMKNFLQFGNRSDHENSEYCGNQAVPSLGGLMIRLFKVEEPSI